jgi:phenylacetate-coenzyme A ligase PaaK-like adenylate-forming protein
LEKDVSERFNVAAKHPQIVSQLLEQIAAHQADIEPHQDMLAIPLTTKQK